MQERSHPLAANLALLTKREHRIRRSRALARDRTLQALVADLVAARTAAGMTQEEVAISMRTTKSAVSRLESGAFARPATDLAGPGPESDIRACCAFRPGR